MAAGSNRIKVICRYQQFRAVHKILKRMREGETSLQRSGVIWHTQGSGKSLIMVFLVRKLRRMQSLKDYNVLMVSDRRDLEEQLTQTAGLTGETVVEISSSREAKSKLSSDASNLNMVMIHKFREEDASFLPDSVRKALSAEYKVALDSEDETRVAEAAVNYQVEVACFNDFGGAAINNLPVPEQLSHPISLTQGGE